MFSLGYWCYFLPLLALYIQLTGSKHHCCFLKLLKFPSFKPLSMSFTESNKKSPHIFDNSNLKLTLSGISFIAFLRTISAVIERLGWGSSYKTIARLTNFIEHCNLRAKHCNHNSFDSGLSLVPLWMRSLAPSMFPSPPLSNNSKVAASIHNLTACGCNFRVLA